MPNALQKLLQRLQELNEVGAALSRERDIDHLLERILDAAQMLTHADAGTLYRVTPDGGALRFALVRTHSLGLHQGGSSGQAVGFPDLPLHLPDGRPNDSLVAVHAAVHDCTVSIADAYDSTDFDFAGARAFDKQTGYRSRSFLTVPLKNHDSELVGVLQLINAIDPATGAVRAFSTSMRSRMRCS
ncbi:MAG TPA: GAF domain-containing protein, partial [Alicycliphilus sp.]|nr:GAF domain-containing protein [Alicycliphilus sp.]